MTTEADVINEVCQQAAWSGGSSFFPTMNSYSVFKTQLDEWAQFTLYDLSGIASNLTINSTGTSFNNGVLVCNFTLNGKTSTAFGWARNKGKTADGPTYLNSFGSNGKVALIIPGSGLNQADQMISYNTGYQSIVYNPVCILADAVVQVLPCMDFTLLKGANGKGVLMDTVDSYLIEHGSSLAIVNTVFACALLKFLNISSTLSSSYPTYTKTAVLGISKAGYISTLVGLLMSPDVCVCASGLSLATEMQGLELTGGNKIPGILSIYNTTTLPTLINNSSTKFRFSKSSVVPEIAVMLREITTGYTDSLLNGANVTNVTHTGGHTYDPGLGTWLASNL